MYFKSSRKEHMDRPFFANRFGMLYNCLAILPNVSTPNLTNYKWIQSVQS
jgi:hypothetical protein